MSKKPDKREVCELVGDFVSIFLRPGGRIWQAYYRHAGKTIRISLKTKSRKEARLRALALERSLENGQSLPLQAPLIGEIIDEYINYLQGVGRADKTIKKYRHGFKLVTELASELKVRRLDGINHRFVDRFRSRRAELSQKISPSRREKDNKQKTVRNDVVLIRQLINFALRRNLIQADPLKGLEFDKAQSASQPYWTKEQTELVVAASKPAYQAYFRFLAETGVRAGEAIWLTWADVDFQNGVIHIQPKEGWKPKTGDQRVIPMSPALRHMLEAQPRIAHWVFCARPSTKCRQVGRQIDSRRALASLKTVLKRLGLPGHQHTFRHSFISHALTSGVPEAIVRSWVGHVDDHIIRTYTHIADQISRDAMRKLSAPDGKPANGDGPAAA